MRILTLISRTLDTAVAIPKFPFLYVRTLPDDSQIYLILYMDGVLIVGKDKTGSLS